MTEVTMGYIWAPPANTVEQSMLSGDVGCCSFYCSLGSC